MSWTADKYFAKAQAYWSRATQGERDAEDFLLSVSFFCEFAIRGALCTKHASLNAAYDEDSLLHAAGAQPNKPPKTIDINQALQRLGRLIPDLTQTERDTLDTIFVLRNKELHGDESPYAEVSADDVLPPIYSFIVKTLQFSNQDINIVLGTDDAALALRTADAALKDRKRRIAELIRIQKDRFFGLAEEEQKRRRNESKPKFVAATLKSGHRLITRKCPACAELGLLGGTPIGRSSPILSDDGIFEELRIVPDIFECKCCELKINGLDELMAAGIPYEFRMREEKDVIDHFGIDPMEYIDVEKVIREYHEDMNPYMDE